MTEDELVALFASISNWGRWGADDQRGTANLITPEVIVRASAEVREGVQVGCGSLDTSGDGRGRSVGELEMLTLGAHDHGGPGLATESVRLAFHGPGHTHLDALCHVVFRGSMYNGRASTEITETGASANAVTAFSDGVVTRGVLLDIPALRGQEWIDPARPVTADELDAALVAQGTDLLPGDALIVHVGRAARRRELGMGAEFDRTPVLGGLDAAALRWLRDHDVALLGSDGGNDARPAGDIGEIVFPIHVGALVYLGLPLIDNMSLDRLVAHCRSRGRYAFSFACAPLAIARGTGSPINPIATF